MSVLETPRLIFRGQITWDPIVTNNLPEQYDEAKSQTVFDATVPSVTAFRTAAIASVIAKQSDGTEIISNWNVDGTHRSTFFDTYVSGVDLGGGPSTDDPIVGCPVSLMGMLVDLEPYGGYTSQFFFDDISFGIAGGCRVLAPRKTRMTARYINFFRNTMIKNAGPASRASVVWQTSFPKDDGLVLDPHGSTAIERFRDAMADKTVKGLTIRWNAYRTIYFDSLDPNANNLQVGRDLQAQLSSGGFQPNPARSQIVGVLGLWREGEPSGEPGDRALLSLDEKTIASANARFSKDRLTIDLSNSVPETGFDLTKKDLGTLSVVASSAGPEIVNTTIASFSYDSYDRAAYEATAGIVTLEVDPAVIGFAATSELRLVSKTQALLAEQTLRAIPERGNNYLEQGETKNLQVLVLDRGTPAGAGVSVTLASPDTATLASVSAQTNASGIAEFPLIGAKGSIERFTLSAGPGAPPPGLDPQTTTYVYVRTWPADTSIANHPPTWNNVHHYVLRNWEAMAPCMDNWLRLGDPAQVKAFGTLLKKLTASSNFESFRFMPVTRDLTPGARALLYAFLDGKGAPQLVAGADEPQMRDTRSRAMRGG